MDKIGELLRTTRENSGVSLEEASTDLKIKEIILSNIEDGNIGGFKDVFVLKEYIYDYAKYLGLDPETIIDEFNEYLFEYTSKIPIKEIAQKIKEKQEIEVAAMENKIASPYTKSTVKKRKKSRFILIYILIVILVVVVVIWAIRQLTVNNEVANTITYVK